MDNDDAGVGVAAVDIEVACARPDLQRIVTCRVPSGTTARDALTLSGLAEFFPEMDLAVCPVGVFGNEVDDGYVVRSGDRVEAYRALRMDPREARRRRAASRD